MPQYSTFIVRVWADRSDGLHGQITHVSSQEQRDFRDLNRMVDFIVEHLGNSAGTKGIMQETNEDRGKI